MAVPRAPPLPFLVSLLLELLGVPLGPSTTGVTRSRFLEISPSKPKGTNFVQPELKGSMFLVDHLVQCKAENVKNEGRDD